MCLRASELIAAWRSELAICRKPCLSRSRRRQHGSILRRVHEASVADCVTATWKTFFSGAQEHQEAAPAMGRLQRPTSPLRAPSPQDVTSTVAGISERRSRR